MQIVAKKKTGKAVYMRTHKQGSTGNRFSADRIAIHSGCQIYVVKRPITNCAPVSSGSSEDGRIVFSFTGTAR